jgi:hypothetical protein
MIAIASERVRDERVRWASMIHASRAPSRSMPHPHALPDRSKTRTAWCPSASGRALMALLVILLCDLGGEACRVPLTFDVRSCHDRR